jgi:hypothetical protein
MGPDCSTMPEKRYIIAAAVIIVIVLLFAFVRF